MFYDCITFGGFGKEKQLLKIRCNTLKSLNVIHVLVESRFTFSGKPKPLYFDECREEFKDFPIIHVIVDRPPDADPWTNETYQRNACMSALQGCNDDDIILISDVDEIPRVSVLKDYVPGDAADSLSMGMFYFFLNALSAWGEWKIAKIMSWAYLKTTTPNAVRNGGSEYTIPDAGYHWSYMGSVDDLLMKFSSFSHQEEGVQKHATRENLQGKIDRVESLWGDNKLEILRMTELPLYVQEHQEEFKDLIYVRV